MGRSKSRKSGSSARILCIPVCAFLCGCLLTGCAAPKGDVDVDLTKMSSTMVYAEVLNMMIDPEDYLGKTIRMDGVFSYYSDPRTERSYYTCIIQDATACCAQGIEFEWAGEHEDDDYPPVDCEIEVTGVFTSYEEDGMEFYTVSDAKMERI